MRSASVGRKTKETDIAIEINLDGTGECDIKTSIPFVDHMLTLFAFHGAFDLKISAQGDIEVDFHHLMEDLGITLGDAVRQAVGEKRGIRRYGSSIIPMDESLAQVVIDLSGRPFLVYRVKTPKGSYSGGVEVSLFEDFFRAFTNHGLMNLHILVQYGRDTHHIFEAVFKAMGRALREAVGADQLKRGIPTTKGKW